MDGDKLGAVGKGRLDLHVMDHLGHPLHALRSGDDTRPASIRSATERPSRAPSSTKSVISAIASGWFSFTPRASRPRGHHGPQD